MTIATLDALTLSALKDSFGPEAKDVKLNLSSVLSQPDLSALQTWGTALACAATVNNKVLFTIISEESKEKLSEQERLAALSAASVMASNNVYYRFLSLAKDPQLETIPARLRMSAIKSHGINESDFELFCIAVSAINGCGKCIESHYHVLRERDVSRETILGAIRIASVITAAARTSEACVG